jgi:hypothetical protein
MISMVLLGATLTMGAACGSDKKSATTTAAATVTTAKSATTATTVATVATSPGAAAVEAFCKSADELAAKLKAGKSDPAKLADLTKEATDFAMKAGQLTSTNAADVAAIQTCAQKVATAYTSG